MLLDDMKDLEALLCRLHPNAHKFMTGWVDHKDIARQIATELWLNEAEETKDTQELRHQLKYLRDHGNWDLEIYQK